MERAIDTVLYIAVGKWQKASEIEMEHNFSLYYCTD